MGSKSENPTKSCFLSCFCSMLLSRGICLPCLGKVVSCKEGRRRPKWDLSLDVPQIDTGAKSIYIYTSWNSTPKHTAKRDVQSIRTLQDDNDERQVSFLLHGLQHIRTKLKSRKSIIKWTIELKTTPEQEIIKRKKFENQPVGLVKSNEGLLPRYRLKWKT